MRECVVLAPRLPPRRSVIVDVLVVPTTVAHGQQQPWSVGRGPGIDDVEVHGARVVLLCAQAGRYECANGLEGGSVPLRAQVVTICEAAPSRFTKRHIRPREWVERPPGLSVRALFLTGRCADALRTVVRE